MGTGEQAADPVIRVIDCWKSYEEGGVPVHAVREVNLDVLPGEFLAIAGRSGSGKSTLLNLMGAMDTPSRGSVQIRGNDLAQSTDRQRAEIRRRDVATIFQSFNLLPTLRAAENVMLPGRLMRRPPAQLQREVDALLESVGLAGRASAWPDTLSGGELQRVAIARALINSPAVILADEPTGNLDSHNAELVLDLLVDLCRRHGAAIVMVTHSLEAAARADRMVTMSDGRLESA
ncbi:MAG TPA: ABC transporter ATP-binding protein [Armatimonadota bacterium]|nr:ABC transporter ATP-binding protein [Armatimonadota bacterium]